MIKSQNALHPHNRIHSAIKGTIDICYNVGERHKHYAKEVRHTKKTMLSNSTYTKYPSSINTDKKQINVCLGLRVVGTKN